jgi:hypothetical protein
MGSLPRLEVVVVAALCVWRLSHLVVAEDGPRRVIARLRTTLARVLPAGLLDCFYCTSLWVAVPCALAFATGWRAQLVLALASSAGAILLDRASTRPAATEVAVPYFEREVDHVGMLRTETSSVD